ncbi:MAG TPA: alpha/beta fold hydrolase [Jatrophihabitantaceae bacterium]|jgi:triacylglycerol lipase|nr:alpha/beta fold hydrolase [Jatrophihabitantaceae bacterium]
MARLLSVVSRVVVASILGVVVAATGASSAAGAAAPYPVPYDFLTSAVLAGLRVDADPPGANIWGCRPSTAHPEPVVLVHGTGGNKNDNWQTFAPLLANNGYCVYAFTYGVLPGAGLPLNQVGGLAPIESSAQQMAAFVTKVLAATGAARVDIVGHSQGTFMPDYYAKFLGGANKIDKYVSLAPLWHGTNLLEAGTLMTLGAAYGFHVDERAFGAGAQMLAGSQFVAKLRSGGTPAVAGITYTNIVTAHDELVVPYTSGIESGMTNIVVQHQCGLDLSDHLELVADPVAAADVLNALDPAHPRPVPCRLVLPFGVV